MKDRQNKGLAKNFRTGTVSEYGKSGNTDAAHRNPLEHL
jgi:hypothetical protein